MELDLPPIPQFGNFPYAEHKDEYTTKASFHRVPWDQSYKDTVYFQSNAALNAYLDARPKFYFDDLSYQKMGEPISVGVPFNQMLQWNYLRVTNYVQPVGSATKDKVMDYYYFVTDVQYVSADNTRLVLQLDVWQTYVRTVEWGDAYVETGHVGIAEKGVNFGEDNFLLNPEGFDLGADYRIRGNQQWNISAGSNSLICVVSASDLEGDYGTLDDPKLRTATGSLMEDLPNGAGIYFFKNSGDFKTFMQNTADESWVTQAIISITAVPATEQDVTSSQFESVSLNGVSAWKPKPGARIPVRTEFFSLAAEEFWAGSKYRHLKKFNTFPYSFYECSTYTGEPMVLKREMMKTRQQNGVTGADFDVYIHIAPPAPRLAIVPRAYNTSDGASGALDGEFLNVAQWISNFPQFSVVNSGYIGTMAAQAHSLSQSYKSADWSQQRALASANTSYDQASASIGLANEMNQNQINSMNAQTSLQNTTTAIRAVKDGAFALGGGIASGAKAGPLGAGAGAISGAVSAASTGIDAVIATNQNTQSNSIATSLARQQTSAQTGNMAYVRDTNIDLARFGAKGDYANAIAQINAKVQDAKLTQPSTAGTTGGDAFILGMFGWKFHVKHKHIPRAAVDAIGAHWLRYGYSVNRYVKLPQDLHVMNVFTYWKCSEVYIKSALCPEPVKRALSGVLEKGFTHWRDPNHLEDGSPLTYTNLPIEGYYIR